MSTKQNKCKKYMKAVRKKYWQHQMPYYCLGQQKRQLRKTGKIDLDIGLIKKTNGNNVWSNQLSNSLMSLLVQATENFKAKT